MYNNLPSIKTCDIMSHPLYYPLAVVNMIYHF